MKPHADFACNSKTCKTAKGATVYDLPVNATRCPVCGSRRIIRLFSAPNLSKGISKRTEAMMEREHTRQQRKRDDAKTASRNAPMLGASLKNGVAGAVTEAMTRAGLGNVPVPVPLTSSGVARPSGANAPHIAGIKAAGAVRVTPAAVVNRGGDKDAAWKSTGGTR